MSSASDAAGAPVSNPNCDPAQQNKVQEQLDAWYRLDGREERSHPLHSLYCGLAEKYRALEASEAA